MAINRYPRRCTVSIKRGDLASSPNTLRISLMQTFSTVSVTYVPGHTVCRNASLVTNWPARSISTRSTAYAFGVKARAWPFRHRHSLTESRENGGKAICCEASISERKTNRNLTSSLQQMGSSLLYFSLLWRNESRRRLFQPQEKRSRAGHPQKSMPCPASAPLSCNSPQTRQGMLGGSQDESNT